MFSFVSLIAEKSLSDSENVSHSFSQSRQTWNIALKYVGPKILNFYLDQGRLAY